MRQNNDLEDCKDRPRGRSKTCETVRRRPRPPPSPPTPRSHSDSPPAVARIGILMWAPDADKAPEPQYWCFFFLPSPSAQPQTAVIPFPGLLSLVLHVQVLHGAAGPPPPVAPPLAQLVPRPRPRGGPLTFCVDVHVRACLRGLTKQDEQAEVWRAPCARGGGGGFVLESDKGNQEGPPPAPQACGCRGYLPPQKKTHTYVISATRGSF